MSSRQQRQRLQRERIEARAIIPPSLEAAFLAVEKMPSFADSTPETRAVRSTLAQDRQ